MAKWSTVRPITIPAIIDPKTIITIQYHSMLFLLNQNYVETQKRNIGVISFRVRSFNASA